MRELILMCVALLATRSTAGWTVGLEDDKRFGKLLTLTSESMTVKLAEKQFWTLHSLTVDNLELLGPTGAMGAVCHVGGPNGEKLDDPWIGTGHGKEKLRTFTVVVDGTEVTLTPGATAAGEEVVVTKVSNIGPLDEEAVMTFPAAGDRLVETVTFTAVEDLGKRFRYVYGWMHCTANACTQYKVWRTPTATETGETVNDDGKFHVHGDLRALAQFAPEPGLGIAYVYADTYKAAKYLGTRIWDRKGDNKVYFTPDFSATTLPLGESATYTVTVVPFRAAAATWQAAADTVVDGVIAATGE